MTDNANLKRRVRARAAKTGESYTAARRHLVGGDETSPRRLLIATAQTVLRSDPRSRDQLRDSGARIRALMREAAAAGAALAHFPEGALRSPHKRVVSSRGPEVVADPDWNWVDRMALQAELEAVARLARDLELWVAVGGIDFAAYERDDVDCVLLSTAGSLEFPEVFAVEAAGHAAANSLWVSYAGPAGEHEPPAGLITPNGTWAARCAPADHEDAMVIASIDTSIGERARRWRRSARKIVSS